MQKNLAYFLESWYNLNINQKMKRETNKKQGGETKRE